MTEDHVADDRLQLLLSAMSDGPLNDEQVVELRALLRTDSSGRRQYARQVLIHAMLRWMHSPSETESDLWPPRNVTITLDSPSLLSSSPFTSHTSIGNLLFSYSAGAMLVGMILLICWTWRIHCIGENQFVQVPGNTTKQGDSTTPQLPVGRITDLADCRGHQWSVVHGQWLEIPKLKTAIINSKFFIGDSFILSSGLMEVTYNTGAKVILEGPCTYEIDSTLSGYLAVGKLTAKVENGAGGRGLGTRETNQQINKSTNQRVASRHHLSATNDDLFSIRTPTAIVTDLGTEFGVKVEKSGATHSHVFKGKVKCVPLLHGKGAIDKDAIILEANQSACVARGRDSQVAITREPDQSNDFIRRISKSTSSPLASRSPSVYRLTDLGTLGGAKSRAIAVNADGHVVGEAATTTGVMHAFLFADGKMTDLGNPQDGSSCANDINSHGQVVGVRLLGGAKIKCRTFIYKNGVMQDIGTLGGHTTRATAINDRGTVVGSAHNVNGVEHAFLYNDGKRMEDLGSLGGPSARSWAGGINNNGLIAGWTETSDTRIHAFLYSPVEGMRDLGAFQGHYSMAQGVNNAGHAVGFSATAEGPVHAFIFTSRTGMKDLGTLGGPRSVAIDINRHGQIIGYADGVNDYADRNIHSFFRSGEKMIDLRTEYAHSFLYSNGKMVDLATLVGTGWTSLFAMSINDSGQIAGYGTAPNGGVRAFLLTPVE